MTTVDEYSLAAVPVEQRRGKLSLGTASAFVWIASGNHYLITNWHVVIMVDPFTGKNLHEQGARPTSLRAQFNPMRMIWEKQVREIHLYGEDDRPRWFIHAVHGNKVDVVAIPLPNPSSETNYYPINQMKREQELAIHIGMDVFVLGYPFGASAPGFPVWKRGSIASEPQLAPLSDRYFLIDSSSRPGMSGAAVIRRAWGAHLKENLSVSITAEPVTRVAGIYSGRLHTNSALDAQLGIVWPTTLVDEIISAAKRDPGE